MNDKTKAEQEVFELFGEMRQLTVEEQKEKREALKRISEPTGDTFFYMFERKQKIENSKQIERG